MLYIKAEEIWYSYSKSRVLCAGVSEYLIMNRHLCVVWSRQRSIWMLDLGGRNICYKYCMGFCSLWLLWQYSLNALCIWWDLHLVSHNVSSLCPVNLLSVTVSFLHINLHINNCLFVFTGVKESCIDFSKAFIMHGVIKGFFMSGHSNQYNFYPLILFVI